MVVRDSRVLWQCCEGLYTIFVGKKKVPVVSKTNTGKCPSEDTKLGACVQTD